MALATGSQHLNLLAPAGGAVAAAVGALGSPAVTIQSGSTASFISLASMDAAKFAAGSMIAVDADYTGQTGFVASPYAGAFVRHPITDIDYIRRVTFNVALVAQVTSAGLMLAEPLPGGVPLPGDKLQAVTGFVDREGGCFYQEWSGLFVMPASQGERVFFYYPRLQTASSAEESSLPLNANTHGGHSRLLLNAQFVALPVIDPLDGERVLCYRSFLPAPLALV
jgi:hypothetical protein